MMISEIEDVQRMLYYFDKLSYNNYQNLINEESSRDAARMPYLQGFFNL